MFFRLDPKLENDSDFVTDLALSQVRLSHNAAFPWIILIPKRPHLIEWVDLAPEEEAELVKEIRQASKVLLKLFNPKKINIAALGNVVAQFHVHVIARFANDKAWPNPVWNSGVTENYTIEEKETRVRLLAQAFEK